MNNKAISIKDILSKDTYVIPIYQRNYEWDRLQIARLIEDINSIGNDEQYYLGTLVTFRRNDGSYELVDGQQRHTTLNLIKAVLGERDKFNLDFQARTECRLFFKELSEDIDRISYNEKTQNLERGISIIKDIIYETFGIDEEKKTIFKNKFFDHTFIFRTELPKETELNHYFEIMNNRGEQLEKHEILKALFMSKLETEIQKEVFAKVWEACSFMGDYIWNNGLPKELLLGNFSSLNEMIFLFNKEVKEVDQNITIKELLESNEELPDGFSQEEESKNYKYRSVLEFSTFLLYVYHIITKEENSFDDKKLLEVFKDYLNAEEFIVALLKYRIYFDKYIIKNDLSNNNDSKWGIRTFDTIMETKENAFENTNEEEKIEMLQAMFYYATISNDKKDWILKLLEGELEENDLYAVLKLQFKEIIKDISLEKDGYYPIVPAKTFYYLEYILWEIYYDYVRGEDKVVRPEVISPILTKIDRVKGSFSSFYFRQLSSKEHLLSQNKISTIKVDENLSFDKQEKEREKILHCFGNLCLISSSENSSANKEHPEYKKESFYNNTSLKRLMMFETFSGTDHMKWNTEEIEEHQKEMNILLDFYRQEE